jgi:Ca2+:H+ antiporter
MQVRTQKQADVNTGLLVLGVLCQSLPLLLRYSVSAGEHAVATDTTVLELSRACSFVMLLAYVAYLFFQLKTHRQLFEPQEVEGGDEEEEEAVLGFGSALFWLILMTVVISVLSEYVVGTIEPTSKSWGLSVSFISIILLPIVGNAAEHAGAIIFALKNKLDITLGVALGSATQISMFVVGTLTALDACLVSKSCMMDRQMEFTNLLHCFPNLVGAIECPCRLDHGHPHGS